MKNHNILIVEDETYIRESLAYYFREEGYEVFETGSGEEALDFLKRRRFHVCIVDIRLSGIDGTRTILKIKQLDPQTRILVFTGSLEFQLTGDLVKLGIKEDHIVYKPISDLNVIGEKVLSLIKGNE